MYKYKIDRSGEGNRLDQVASLLAALLIEAMCERMHHRSPPVIFRLLIYAAVSSRFAPCRGYPVQFKLPSVRGRALKIRGGAPAVPPAAADRRGGKELIKIGTDLRCARREDGAASPPASYRNALFLSYCTVMAAKCALPVTLALITASPQSSGLVRRSSALHRLLRLGDPFSPDAPSRTASGMLLASTAAISAGKFVLGPVIDR